MGITGNFYKHLKSKSCQMITQFLAMRFFLAMSAVNAFESKHHRGNAMQNPQLISTRYWNFPGFKFRGNNVTNFIKVKPKPTFVCDRTFNLDYEGNLPRPSILQKHKNLLSWKIIRKVLKQCGLTTLQSPACLSHNLHRNQLN